MRGERIIINYSPSTLFKWGYPLNIYVVPLLHIKKASHDMIVLPTKIIHERRLIPIKDIIMRSLSLEENNVE